MLLLALVLLLAAVPVTAAEPEEWTRPFPGHRVIGNLYAVGSYDLAVFLVTSDDGHILINTGVESSTELIRKNIEAVGFRMEDVKILLSMQAHWDHAAAQAEIKELTGAEMWSTRGDKAVLEDGGFSDPHFGGEASFKPVKVDRVLRDGEVIELGDTRLKLVETPGHTRGSASYTMTVREDGRDYSVAIVNMASINRGKRLVVEPTYPGVASDFAETFRKQNALEPDVWVAAHASQYGLHRKYSPGQAYSPDTFVDPEGYAKAVQRHADAYTKQVAEEKAPDN